MSCQPRTTSFHVSAKAKNRFRQGKSRECRALFARSTGQITLPRLRRPLKGGFFGVFVRFDDGQLRREIERREHVANGTRSHRDAERFQNEIGDDFRGPPFDWPCYDNMACGDGAVEDNFLELLFLYVIEFGFSSGPFFSCEGVEFAIGFFEFPPPILTDDAETSAMSTMSSLSYPLRINCPP